MHGPPLTRSAMAAALKREVDRLTATGLESAAATRVVALDRGVAPEAVSHLIARYGARQREAARV
jgi:hypothetical protein